MSVLVFDIETIGDNFNSYDSLTRAILSQGIDPSCLTEEEYEVKMAEVRSKLGLSALTGQIVSIALQHLPSGRACVVFQAGAEKIDFTDDKGIRYRSMSEAEILKYFWECSVKCTEFVTFNGRCFDLPYMMIRSAVHQIRPSKNLMANRYLSLQPAGAKHVDLMDQLTFYGAIWKGYKLHLCCRAFGIPTPKSEGTDGGHVGEMFKEGRYQAIAEYNMADVFATSSLYQYWNDYLRF